MDVIVPLLARLFPLEVAGAIFCALVLLSTAPAVSLLHYALHGKLSLWPLVSVLFAYNFVFYMGWLNYLLGVNLALIFAALWLKLRRWPIRRSLPLFTAFSTILYFTHLYALGVYGLKWGIHLTQVATRCCGRAKASTKKRIPRLLLWRGVGLRSASDSRSCRPKAATAMNSRVGRLGGHSHDARNLTFLFRSREATTHRVYLNEVDTQLGLIVLGLEISHYSKQRREGVSRSERAYIVALSQFFAPLLLFVAFSPTFHLNLTSVQAGNLIRKIAGIYAVLDTGHPNIDLSTFGVMVAALLAGTVLKSFTLEHRAAAPFWLLTTSFLVMPAVLFGSGFAGYRLPIAIVWFLIAASSWRPGPRWRPKVGVALVSVLLAVRVGAIAGDWRLYHEYQTEFLQAIESVPVGSRVLPYVVAEDSYEFLVRPPKQHLASLAVIQRSVFLPTLFADPGKQPLVLTEPYRALAKDKVRPDLPKAVFSRPMSNPAHPLQKNQVAGYDYVVLFAQDPGNVPVPPFLNEIERGTTFVLYRVHLSK